MGPYGVIGLLLLIGLREGTAATVVELPSGAVMVRFRGVPGDTVRITRRAFCIEYRKAGPEPFSLFSPEGTAPPEIQRLLSITRQLEHDQAVRMWFLVRSPLYRDILRQHQEVTWLLQSRAVVSALKREPVLQRRYQAITSLAEYLLGADALHTATQWALWYMTLHVTPEQLKEDIYRQADNKMDEAYWG